MFRICALFCLVLVVVVGCGRKEKNPPLAAAPVAVLAPPAPLEREVVVPEPLPVMSEYERYLESYGGGARTVKRGEPLVLGEGAPDMLYDGVDVGLNWGSVVVRYEAAENGRFGRVIRRPVISIQPLQRPAGTPNGAVVGDFVIKGFLIHVISADDDEMEYVVEEVKKPQRQKEGVAV